MVLHGRVCGAGTCRRPLAVTGGVVLYGCVCDAGTCRRPLAVTEPTRGPHACASGEGSWNKVCQRIGVGRRRGRANVVRGVRVEGLASVCASGRAFGVDTFRVDVGGEAS